MWLLNASTLKLHSFFENIPEYVILSHTWGEGEVAFEDIDKPYARNMTGYNKIVGCCRLALRDGYEWAWIDTCCIDKRSSAELSEAINSMYDWYWQAAICYAYLSDIIAGEEWNQDLETSRWFTRGWTLQELLAPDIVEFYNAAWIFLGTKAKLLTIIQKATRIDPKYLLSRETIKDASVGTKFSWAALRKTTRLEDMTYCLLGLVQVNMPMLYGEGGRAFHRLQLELIKQSNEHSIFAWEPLQKEWQMTEVLAPTLLCFENAANIAPTASRRPIAATTHEVTNNGLRITLPSIAIGGDRSIALLDCQNEAGRIVGIWLENLGHSRYQRLSGSKLVTLNKDEEEDAALVEMYLVVNTGRKEITRDNSCHLVVQEILAQDECMVNGIIISTRIAATIVKPVFMAGLKELGRDHLRYVLKELLIKDGEAASIRLIIRWDFVDYTIPIVFGLRRGRPAIRSLSHEDAFRMQWSEDMRMNTSGDWDLIGDCIQVRHSPMAVQVESKKMHKNGDTRWALMIKLYRCTCSSSKEAGEACTCDITRIPLNAPKPFENQRKSILCARCSKPCLEAEVSWCACDECKQKRAERRPLQDNLCKYCRVITNALDAFDALKQLIDKSSGKHYIECPCNVCKQESKIECWDWQDGAKTRQSRQMPWLKTVKKKGWKMPSTGF
jgi:hypothetical protein